MDAVGLMEGQLNWWEIILKLDNFARNQISLNLLWYIETICKIVKLQIRRWYHNSGKITDIIIDGGQVKWNLFCCAWGRTTV